ncbi:MAG: polymerase delta prime subunit [Bacteriovoracaceae bacterium]|nr:polymerase delta prime subunit [Bacteriovoracaceae bacterium]
MLENFFKQKKFPSPLILEGGSERTTLILKMAGYALCETQTACGTCRSCKQVTKGFHPDWLALNSAVKIEELREKLFQLRQRPFQSKVRFFSYDDAQEASVFVQNALLKTLEEPLPHWVLVLGVNSKLSLLQTIRSRCLFYKIPETGAPINLTDEEENLFRFIAECNELFIQKEMDTLLKDRQKTKATFQKLLQKSAEKKYPGHWMNLSPYLEQTIPELARNLNPRLVWDRAWAKSFTETI